ncbi:MAG: HpcH/HpaI aldolase/citrate lyase family protein [Syntrophorhabdus sp. PtaU1.Bin153]|nr:MAG: HpcH/HpaI aldolase/citrate lyase family protein [Syntrophorhabdus sp. PtaU1.Bin153]
MNRTEIKMVDLLKELKETHSVVGVKAEFEAEGTRTEELMRLKEICMSAGITLTLKIGGCEAVRDMYDARTVGVNYLVAPMVETPFALQKYLRAIDLVFSKEEQDKIDFLVNIETVGAVQQFTDMLRIDEIGKLNGIVVGRVDLVGSMGLDRAACESEKVFNITDGLAAAAKERGMTVVVGGAISASSLPFLKKLCDRHPIDRYETRKICFSCQGGVANGAEKGIEKAVLFELMWLQNKRSYYQTIAQEDEKRITMLEARHRDSQS